MTGGKSIKALLKEAVDVRTAFVICGNVIRASPLEIQAANDEKLILTDSNMYVPKRLTDHEIDVVIESGDSGGTSSNDGHSHTVAISSFNKAKIKVKNALKVGDEVYLLSFDAGQMYYVLDRTE